MLCVGLLFLGSIRGFVRQIASLAGLLLGHLAGVRYYGEAKRLASLDFPYGEVAGYLLLFVAVYLVVRLLGLLIEKLVRLSGLSGMDRFAGALVGLAKGAVFSILLVFFLVVFLPPNPPLLTRSKLAPHALWGARQGAVLFPARFAEIYREKAMGLHPPPPPGPGKRDGKKR